MANREMEIALLRVMCGLAWADGQVSPEERKFLQGLAVEFGLTSEESAQIEELLSRPIALEDFEGLVGSFRGTVASPGEKTQLLDRADRLIGADGVRDRAESRYLSLLKEWLSEEDSASSRSRTPEGGGIFSRLRAALGGPRSSSSPSLGAMVGDLVGRMGDDKGSSEPGVQIAAERRDFVLLFGALLYRVIYADQVVDPAEATRLREILRDDFAFADGEVEYMIRMIQRRVAEDLDRQRLCAEFNRMTDMDERLSLLEALFTVAQADGEASEAELREIRLISNYLWIDVQEFVRVRQKVLRG